MPLYKSSFLTVVLLSFGIVSACNIGAQDSTKSLRTSVAVQYEAPGASPEEMSTISSNAQAALSNILGVKRISSACRNEQATIWVEFERGTRLPEARQSVAQRLGDVIVPPFAEDPRLLAPASEVVFLLALKPQGNIEQEEGEPFQIKELRSFAQNELRRQLITLADVSDVQVHGGYRRRYEVFADTKRVSEFDLTIDQVALAIRKANLESPAGGGDELLIRNAFESNGIVDNLAAAVIGNVDGRPLLVRDVADVRLAWASEADQVKERIATAQPERKDAIHENVIVSVLMNAEGDADSLSDQIDDVIDAVRADLPPSVKLDRSIGRNLDILVDHVGSELSESLPFTWNYQRETAPDWQDHLVLAQRDQIVARLIGPNLEVLQENAKKALASLRATEATRAARLAPANQVADMRIKIKEDAISELGVEEADVFSVLRYSFGTQPIVELMAGNEVLEVVLMTRQRREDPTGLKDIRVRAQDGTLVPIDQLVEVSLHATPEVLYFEDGRHTVFLTCRTDKKRRAAAMASFKKALQPINEAFAESQDGYFIRFDKHSN